VRGDLEHLSILENLTKSKANPWYKTNREQDTFPVLNFLSRSSFSKDITMSAKTELTEEEKNTLIQAVFKKIATAVSALEEATGYKVSMNVDIQREGHRAVLSYVREVSEALQNVDEIKAKMELPTFAPTLDKEAGLIPITLTADQLVLLAKESIKNPIDVFGREGIVIGGRLHIRPNVEELKGVLRDNPNIDKLLSQALDKAEIERKSSSSGSGTSLDDAISSALKAEGFSEIRNLEDMNDLSKKVAQVRERGGEIKHVVIESMDDLEAADIPAEVKEQLKKVLAQMEESGEEGSDLRRFIGEPAKKKTIH
jgi:hypothetical protein